MKWVILVVALNLASVGCTKTKPLAPLPVAVAPAEAPESRPASGNEPIPARESQVVTLPVKDSIPAKTSVGTSSGAGYRSQAPEPSVRAGHFVLVNKHLNVLWHYQDGKLVEAYRVATGRDTSGPSPTWVDYATNFLTPEGTFRLTNFAVLENDNAWVWGIHGTSEPEKIGGAVSDGCIRMLSAEAEVLFDQLLGENAVLQVIEG